MICPKCKTGDVQVSQRSNDHFMSFLWVNMRCHRCCNLFTVPRWKVSSANTRTVDSSRKAA